MHYPRIMHYVLRFWVDLITNGPFLPLVKNTSSIFLIKGVPLNIFLHASLTTQRTLLLQKHVKYFFDISLWMKLVKSSTFNLFFDFLLKLVKINRPIRQVPSFTYLCEIPRLLLISVDTYSQKDFLQDFDLSRPAQRSFKAFLWWLTSYINHHISLLGDLPLL